MATNSSLDEVTAKPPVSIADLEARIKSLESLLLADAKGGPPIEPSCLCIPPCPVLTGTLAYKCVNGVYGWVAD